MSARSLELESECKHHVVTVEVKLLCGENVVAFASAIGRGAEGIYIGLLILVLISHVGIDVFAAIAHAESDSVDSAKVYVVGVEAISVGWTLGESVEISLLLKGDDT